MSFNENHKSQAEAFEAVVGATLVKHFIEVDCPKPLDHAALAKMSIGEQLEEIRKSVNTIQKAEKNTKLLNDIREGKYRLLFLALAKGLEDLHEDFDGFFKPTEKMKEMADFINEEFNENEEDE